MNCILMWDREKRRRTTSISLQRNLEANVEKRTKDSYGPAAGKKLMVFIDDMNMPKMDLYGTQQPIALLKLLLGRGGLYERGENFKSGEGTNWKNIKDCGYVAAMVVCVIATLVHLLNVILTIVYWAAWTQTITRTHGIHALLVIALIFHVSVTACTMTLTYKCRKAHKVAKNEMAAPQTVVNYPSHPGTVVTGTIVEMAPPAYEKA